MAFYSIGHYARVSPRADTPAEIASRRLLKAVLDVVVAERDARWPTLTADNMAEALRWQTQVINEFTLELLKRDIAAREAHR